MERKTCNLCLKAFSNGRALGGHMRSHMALAPLQRPTPSPPPPPPPPPPKIQLSRKHLGGELAPSLASSSSTSSSSEEEEGGGLGYVLRENPKKSFRLVDPEFAGSSIILQDRESETETESPRNNNNNNTFRRRSKRTRKICFAGSAVMKKPKLYSNSPEPLSSVSDTTTPDEDVALCLMMLSRGTWETKIEVLDEPEKSKSGDETDDEEDKLEEIKHCSSRIRGKYQCGTCKKLFKSYQALGGHRASHKKIKGCSNEKIGDEVEFLHAVDANVLVAANQKIHECPVCFRIFGSGQALGGHKRSHVSGSSSTPTPTPTPTPTSTPTPPIIKTSTTHSIKYVDMIDLNLPAPMEDDDDDVSVVEVSAVSDP
ncbi:hypothetical protein GIB67_001231 [Kingdonia uniflora]|uniref:C2H2-type domain-containing protein n=1 Tax=Kingdonia uniflora TaxID=39325 RepID=A0A7J7LGL2_9MAGN|nr:hypothetical protein GIB67_001231 [Kingdonia uniflora]